MVAFHVEQQGECTFLTCTVEEDALDSVVSGMMARNSINGLLPYSTAQINGTRVCSYNITSQVSLKQFFSRPVTQRTLTKVMLGILNTVETAKEYLIQQSDILFDSEYIFVSVSSGFPALLCLPVQKDAASPDMLSFFRQLLFTTSFDEHEDRSYVAELITFMNQPAVRRYSEFRNFLEGMLNRTEEQAIPTSSEPNVAVHNESPNLTEQSIVQDQPDHTFHNIPAPPVRKKKVGFFAGLKKKKGKTSNQQADNSIPSSTLGYNVPGFNVPYPGSSEANVTVSRTYQGNTEQELKQPQVFPAKDIAMDPMPYDINVVDLVSEETVVVHGGNASASGTNGTPWLIQLRTGKEHPIQRMPYRIGKEPSYVDFCVAGNAAVSRSHADIHQDEAGYWITDNNSKNHTFMDGRCLTPGQPYPLIPGTHFFLANEEFIFEVR